MKQCFVLFRFVLFVLAGQFINIPASYSVISFYVLFHRIIQQLVNGIIAPTAMPNIGVGPW